MPNPRFLQTAERWKNKEVPAERTKPRETKPSSSGLTQILERDEDGKPKLNLTPIEKTVVSTPTQEDYWDLMRVYECGGWEWGDGTLPIRHNYWETYKEETCMEVGIDILRNKGKLGYAYREFYQREGGIIISTNEFYENQKITPEMLNEINIWFDKNGK